MKTQVPHAPVLIAAICIAILALMIRSYGEQQQASSAAATAAVQAATTANSPAYNRLIQNATPR